MKITVTFNMPDDQEDYNLMMQGKDANYILSELSNWLRQKYKYEDQETITIEEVREKLYNLCTEHNVDI